MRFEPSDFYSTVLNHNGVNALNTAPYSILWNVGRDCDRIERKKWSVYFFYADFLEKVVEVSYSIPYVIYSVNQNI